MRLITSFVIRNLNFFGLSIGEFGITLRGRHDVSHTVTSPPLPTYSTHSKSEVRQDLGFSSVLASMLWASSDHLKRNGSCGEAVERSCRIDETHVTKGRGFVKIGNSVPPLLAGAVALQVVAALPRAIEADADQCNSQSWRLGFAVVEYVGSGITLRCSIERSAASKT